MRINPSGPSLSQLRAFLAVAEFLHFRAAASALGVSQPTLSAAVAGCEEALGTRLVERTTRRVMLTTAGERLVPRVRAVLDAVDALVDEAEAVGRPFVGPLRLGIIPTVAPYLLPVALHGLRSAFPGLEPEVHEERTARLLEGLATGRLDAAILALPAGGRGLVEIPLYSEDFVLVVPRGHGIAGSAGVARSVLRELEVLLLEEGHCLRDQALDVCREVGGRVETATRAASLGTLVQLVAAGMGVTLLPETAVPVETRRAGLSVAHFGAPAPGRRIGLVHRESAGRSVEFAEIAAQLRRAVRTRRLPVRLTR
ncbi:LysR family transcriptional regulator, hydrogen peroxide-inducible genes activator [Streptoalloteichus tenebrarius]|uniref:Probable hydrogen peroxide-inducible genes activator n=1 Tax=Streptoalloteichus tenebrarius (strain ATCC 17920 / DSM 40477 / JCM 4838 / CBS 697.72 / NBRC 16177 / NCIMB 11028 / NRRL B-12390 / A12253. 1 / ISP 5477) TaxID=1933 RepID=A0ABT1I2N1_STRSD|nr:LysR substrate-binding domain-containing protein [Streptoalloteichus tenebrarius]MCP2262047.1 LysR family transcriptional regulator, hydrogen peroxide-inducible genes activator [Streptoalloteichus tenebrarius]BFF01313.1 LysR substrate-binding domain-containing protein [Streptoalloteichus tenebrarius]